MADVTGSYFVDVTVKIYGMSRAKIGIWIIGKVAKLFGIKIDVDADLKVVE